MGGTAEWFPDCMLPPCRGRKRRLKGAGVSLPDQTEPFKVPGLTALPCPQAPRRPAATLCRKRPSLLMGNASLAQCGGCSVYSPGLAWGSPGEELSVKPSCKEPPILRQRMVLFPPCCLFQGLGKSFGWPASFGYHDSIVKKGDKINHLCGLFVCFRHFCLAL